MCVPKNYFDPSSEPIILIVEFEGGAGQFFYGDDISSIHTQVEVNGLMPFTVKSKTYWHRTSQTARHGRYLYQIYEER